MRPRVPNLDAPLAGSLRGRSLNRLLLGCLLAGLLGLPPAPARARNRALPVPGTRPGERALPTSQADLNAGNVVYTVTDAGAHGWFDPQGNALMGAGFQFNGFPSALFHAGLIIAADPNTVADACYGSDDNGATIPFNFRPVCAVATGEGPAIAQYAFAGFDDSDPDNAPPMFLSVNQLAFALTDAGHEDVLGDVVYIEFEILSQQADLSLFVGWYADWDIGEYSQNMVGYDASSQVGYAWDASGADPNYYGVTVLTHPPSGFRAVHNPTFVYPGGEFPGDPGFEDADKFDFLQGFDVAQSDVPDDWSVEIGAGPIQFPAGEARRVAFLMGAGESLDDLIANMESARARHAFPLCRPELPCP